MARTRADLIWELRNIAEDGGPGASRDLAMDCVRELQAADRAESACRQALPVVADAIAHGMPVTKAVADTRNALCLVVNGFPRADEIASRVAQCRCNCRPVPSFGGILPSTGAAPAGTNEQRGGTQRGQQ